MVCNNCGNQNVDNANNCAFCGAPLNAQQAAPQAAPQQPPMGQPMYQQPMYQQPVQAPSVPGKGLGIAGMVLGIVSLALWCFIYLAIPCAIIGLILSAIGMKKAKDVGMKNGMAVAGIVCSAIALGILVIIWIIGMMAAASVASDLNDLADAMDMYY